MKLVQISACMSLDGFIDDNEPSRLVLSGAEDLACVRQARAEFDAILVGANTIRRDNPSLLIDRQDLIKKRQKRGQSPMLAKVTLTRCGDLDRNSRFFAADGADKFVICSEANAEVVGQKLAGLAQILSLDEVDARGIVKILAQNGVNSLFVEGGSQILSLFLSQGVFHRLRLAIAPFFVGDPGAPKFVLAPLLAKAKKKRLKIIDVSLLGDTAVLEMENEAGFDV